MLSGGSARRDVAEQGSGDAKLTNAERWHHFAGRSDTAHYGAMAAHCATGPGGGKTIQYGARRWQNDTLHYGAELWRGEATRSYGVAGQNLT